MSSKLLITTWDKGVLSAIYENDKAAELHFQSQERQSLVGNIYIARVKNVLKNIHAAFLDLGNGITGYYPIGESYQPIYTKKGSSPAIQQGDELLVQIKKDAVKTKDPAVTGEISISSAYFVGILNDQKIHYSAKIDKGAKNLLTQIISQVPDLPIGLIVRTNAAQAEETELLQDLRNLIEKCLLIRQTAPFRSAACCIYQSHREYLSLIKNMDQSKLEEIITDQPELYQEIETYLKEEQNNLLPRLRLYQDRLLPLYKLYSLETVLQEASQKNVWLKCGGYIVIEETEALTVIDVNSGKYEGKKNLEDTFLKINMEAAAEIAKQIRLRNISGIIIVDFINHKNQDYQRRLLEEFQSLLNVDSVKANVIDITPLGLVEVTRKRTKATLREQFMKKNN